MQNFFLKNKKPITLALMFMFALFCAYPVITSAATTTTYSSTTTTTTTTTSGTGGTVTTTSGWSDTDVGQKATAMFSDNAENSKPDDLGSFLLHPVAHLEVAAGNLIVNGSFKICVLSGVLLSYTMSTLMSAPITTDTKFIPAWSSVRNLANMFIVLGFVVVGIATALRIKQYQAGQLLWRLVLIALVINFSGLFCGLIIDASNFITNGLSGAVNGIMPIKVVSQISAASTKILSNQAMLKNQEDYVGKCILFALVYLGTTFTFLYLAILLFARYAILILLYVLSPLAFAFWIFPNRLKTYQSEWWENFLKWSFVGVFGSFVLFISTKFLNAVASSNSTDIVSVATSCAIFLVFIYTGFEMTAKQTGLASWASQKIMGAAAGVAGLAKGTVKMGAKGIGAAAKAEWNSRLKNTKTGGAISDAVDKAKNRWGRYMEKSGFKPTGSTAEANNKKVESEAGLMAKEYASAKATNDTARMAHIESLAAKGKGAQGAAAMKVLSESGDLDNAFKGANGKTDEAAKMARIQYAEAAGAIGVRDKEEKKNPLARKHNERLIDKKIEDHKKEGKTFKTGAEARKAAETAVVMDGLQKASVADMKEYSTETLESEEFRDYLASQRMPAKKIEAITKEMSSSKVDAVKKHIPHLKEQMYTKLGVNKNSATLEKDVMDAYNSLPDYGDLKKEVDALRDKINTISTS